MNIAIICSGGDCSGLNPAIKRFAEHALQCGLTPYGVYDGLEGLIDGNIEPLTPGTVSGIIHRGGTVLRSSRSKRFLETATRQRAADQLRVRKINHLVMLGGDGSQKAMRCLHEEASINIACIPATIDNDVPGSDYSIGVDTALNVIRHAIDSIRDTASSFRRAFVVETMGRNCGYLALVSAVTSGAEVCLAPDLDIDFDGIKRRLQADLDRGRRYAIAVVSEAVKDGSERMMQLFKEEIGIECRLTVLGHVQRGGAPTVYDRRMAAELSTAAVDALLAGSGATAITCWGGQISPIPLSEDQSRPQAIDPNLLALASRLAH